MSLTLEPDGCDCRGRAGERHTVRALFRGSDTAIVWEAVPADKAHYLVQRVAGHDAGNARVPVVIERAATWSVREGAEQQTRLPAAVIVVVPGDVVAAQLA